MTTRTAITICAFALLMINTGNAQNLESYRKKYDDGLSEIAADHQRRIEDITKSYSSGLNTVKVRIQAAGDLDKLKAVMEEISRFQMAKTLPIGEEKPFPEVLALVNDCQAKLSKAQEAKAHRIVVLASQYDKALLRLQLGYTRKGDIDKATAVQEERNILAATKTVTAARAVLAQAKTDKRKKTQPEPTEENRDAGMKDITHTLSGGRKTSAGIVLKNQRLTSRDRYTTPVEIEYVCKTDSTNIRLVYACDQLIFNWEVNLDELRIDGGPVSRQHRKGSGRIPVGRFVTIRQIVKRDQMNVFVDDELRASWQGDFSRVKSPIGVFSALGSTVTVKSIRVQQLNDK